jgi:hypothetical protein
LFFSYGLRAEWNPTFGDKEQPNYAPRFGTTYTQDIGAVTVKMRASYGRSTRPPTVGQKLAERNVLTDITPVYGPFDSRIANAFLEPEYQQGGEGGLDLYFGSRASLVITRYNQTVDNLIVSVPGADSIRSLVPNPVFFGVFTCAQMISFQLPTYCASQDAAGYGYALLSQNLNAAGIRNQGWEMSGSLTTGPITTRGTYSWTKSRSMGVKPEYLKYFQGVGYAQYQPGATFQFLPEHTWALGMTYARATTTVSINVNGISQLLNSANSFALLNLHYAIRLPSNKLNGSVNFGGSAYSAYTSYNSGYALADISATQRLSSHIEGILQVQNLANQYTNDADMSFAVMGRQTKLGIRIR